MVPPGSCNNTIIWVTCKQQKFMSNNSKGREFPDQGLADLASGKDLLTGSWMGFFSLCPHMVDGAKETSKASSVRAPPSGPNHLLKSYLGPMSKCHYSGTSVSINEFWWDKNIQSIANNIFHSLMVSCFILLIFFSKSSAFPILQYHNQKRNTNWIPFHNVYVYPFKSRNSFQVFLMYFSYLFSLMLFHTYLLYKLKIYMRFYRILVIAFSMFFSVVCSYEFIFLETLPMTFIWGSFKNSVRIWTWFCQWSGGTTNDGSSSSGFWGTTGYEFGLQQYNTKSSIGIENRVSEESLSSFIFYSK